MQSSQSSSVLYSEMAVQFEGIQSATPFRMTDPRVRRPVHVADPCKYGMFRRSFNVVMYYGAVLEGRDSGWHSTVWIKESLCRAFAEWPLLCGRLRRVEDCRGNREFEIISNDSGARLIELRIEAKLDDFLVSEGREDRETGLVYWKDIDEEEPQYSPLLYIQVTNFQCGGYSIGLSCSLIVSDAAEIISFIKRWATIHAELETLHPKDDPRKPIFRLFDVKRMDSSKLLTPSPCRKLARTIAFAAEYAKGISPGMLALACTKEAEKELGAKAGSSFSVMVRDATSEAVSVSTAKGNEDFAVRPKSIWKVDWGTWIGDGVTFREGNEALSVSCWVGSEDGFVMVTPSGMGRNEGGVSVNVLVAIP